MTEQPWELIRRAADHLEKLAEATGTDDAARTWETGASRALAIETEPHDAIWDGHGACLTGGLAVPDARWIATLSPAVAQPLAAWLRSAADTWENWGSRTLGPALDFAHKILGEQP